MAFGYFGQKLFGQMQLKKKTKPTEGNATQITHNHSHT